VLLLRSGAIIFNPVESNRQDPRKDWTTVI
jgi:hypothetical protein